MPLACSIPDRDARGQRVLDVFLLLRSNAHHEPIEFTLPPKEFGAAWHVVVFTGPDETTPADAVPGGGTLAVEAHTAVVLQAPEEASAG
jgi:glycogen operon protein